MRKKTLLQYGLIVGIFVLVGHPAAAVNDTEFTQVITSGVLNTSIRDAARTVVTNPSVAMSPLSVSTECQTATGTYGTNTQRIYVENPGASASGWVLSLAATNGSSAQWDSGANQYGFNNPAGSGCDAGQMTVDPDAASVTPQSPATATGISKGSLAAFSAGVVDTIELVNAGASSDDFWLGYLSGVHISQQVPAATPVGNYMVDLTQTVVAQ